jgi:hypothetical protein
METYIKLLMTVNIQITSYFITKYYPSPFTLLKLMFGTMGQLGARENVRNKYIQKIPRSIHTMSENGKQGSILVNNLKGTQIEWRTVLEMNDPQHH